MRDRQRLQPVGAVSALFRVGSKGRAGDAGAQLTPAGDVAARGGFTLRDVETLTVAGAILAHQARHSRDAGPTLVVDVERQGTYEWAADLSRDLDADNAAKYAGVVRSFAAAIAAGIAGAPLVFLEGDADELTRASWALDSDVGDLADGVRRVAEKVRQASTAPAPRRPWLVFAAGAAILYLVILTIVCGDSSGAIAAAAAAPFGRRRFAPVDRPTGSAWSIVASNARVVLIRDDGGAKSVTNDAEHVVADLLPVLNGRRLFYVDTIGRVDELATNDRGGFAGFAAGFDSVDAFSAKWFSPLGGGEL